MAWSSKVCFSSNVILTSYNGSRNVVFYDSGVAIVNFTHNFSAQTKIDLRNVTIVKDYRSILVNFSGQLGGTKTLSLADNNFTGLCVKDAEVASIGDVSNACNASGELNFTSCLGNSTGVTSSGITCVDEGSLIRVSNLSYSAVKGITATVEYGISLVVGWNLISLPLML